MEKKNLQESQREHELEHVWKDQPDKKREHSFLTLGRKSERMNQETDKVLDSGDGKVRESWFGDFLFFSEL